MDILLKEPMESEVPMNEKQKRTKFNKEFKADNVESIYEILTKLSSDRI